MCFTTSGPKRNHRANGKRLRINELRLAQILRVQDFLISKEADLPTEYRRDRGAAADPRAQTLNGGGLDYTRGVSRPTPRTLRERFSKTGGLPGCPSWIF